MKLFGGASHAKNKNQFGAGPGLLNLRVHMGFGFFKKGEPDRNQTEAAGTGSTSIW